MSKNAEDKPNNVLDFQTEAIKKNAPKILEELYRKHEETGECGIYDILPNGKLGEKKYDL